MVEVFIQVLAGKDVRYRHGEDADFDAELALEKRVHDYAVSRAIAQADEAVEPTRGGEPEPATGSGSEHDDDPRPDDNGAGEKTTEVPTSVARASARGVDPQQPKAG